MNHAVKLADRFRVSDNGPSSARRQRVDPDVELEEGRSQLSETKIEETKQRIHLSQDPQDPTNMGQHEMAVIKSG